MDSQQSPHPSTLSLVSESLVLAALFLVVEEAFPPLPFAMLFKLQYCLEFDDIVTKMYALAETTTLVLTTTLVFR